MEISRNQMMNNFEEGQNRGGGILNINYAEKDALYKAYMPFVNNGAIFIPTVKDFELGHEIFLVLGLPDESEKIPVSCRVIWITPVAAQGNRTPGIGVQFRDYGVARTKIETVLAGLLHSDLSTYTM